ncbi:MAG: hypothetical protein JWO56_3739 [Acidobacteria bacterium]|nr:hypothetical protein [Acidobacteriota bacterium]
MHGAVEGHRSRVRHCPSPSPSPRRSPSFWKGALPGGENGCTRRSQQIGASLFDLARNPSHVVENFLVAETEDAYSELSQRGGANRIALPCVVIGIVNGAVELHRQRNARTVEIDDVAADPMLAAKLEDATPAAAANLTSRTPT